MLRALFPLLTLLALGLFAVSALISVALAFALPLAALGLAALLVLASRVRGDGAVAVYRAALREVGTAVGYVADAGRCLAYPLRERPALDTVRLADCPTPQPWVRLTPLHFPPLRPLLEEAASGAGVPPVAAVCVSPDTTLAVVQVHEEGRRQHVLFLGLGLLHLMTVDELRAALAHEMAHAQPGQRAVRSWVEHSIDVLLAARLRSSAWMPSHWGSRLALATLGPVYLPWRRQRELDADRHAALRVGANHVVSGLRAAHEGVHPYALALRTVVEQVTRTRVAPVRLTEAAAAWMRALPAPPCQDVSREGKGDRHGLASRTHPPTALRIAALADVPAGPARDGRNAARALGAALLDERLTRRWLAHAQVVRWDARVGLPPAEAEPGHVGQGG